MKEEHLQLFDPFRIGDMTDKGEIKDLFFLQFTSSAAANKVYEPKGKGLLMATIGGKNYVIGNLKKL